MDVEARGCRSGRLVLLLLLLVLVQLGSSTNERYRPGRTLKAVLRLARYVVARRPNLARINLRLWLRQTAVAAGP
jgi:hypothetical protein